MNRRNFLTALVALPVVVTVARAIEFMPEPPKKIIMSTQYGYLGDDIRKLIILNPVELRRNGLTPVETPCFIENHIPYCAKTWRLKTYCDGTPDVRAIIGAKRLVLFEIQRLQLTHVYCVAFNPAPIWMHDNALRYSTFVRGCRLKSWNFTEQANKCPPASYDAKSV
jgi:hypothetical protein